MLFDVILVSNSKRGGFQTVSNMTDGCEVLGNFDNGSNFICVLQLLTSFGEKQCDKSLCIPCQPRHNNKKVAFIADVCQYHGKECSE